jgi:hypothetical protein
MVMLAAAACSSGASAPAATATPEGEIRPPSTEATAPCTRRELEAWLQHSGSLVFEYAQEVNNNLATPPDQMGAVIERLSTLRGSMQGTTAPPCAVDHYDMIMAMMNNAIETLTSYAQGNGLDLVSFATQSNAVLDEVRAREAQLAALYDSLPRE